MSVTIAPYGDHKQATIVRKDDKLDSEVTGLLGNENELYEKSKTYREIRAYFSSGKEGSFKAPFVGMKRGGMNGMRVDSRYLWVFNQLSIACTTHTSVKQYLLNEIKAHLWISYAVPKELHGDFYLSSRRDFDGLIDLWPCDDGTLVAVFSDTRDDEWKSLGYWNDNIMYYLTPRINRAAKTFIVEGTKQDDYGHSVKTNGWVRDKDGYKAHRLLKQPIFCWSMIEKFITTLQNS